jgi:hypothetical protein
MSNEVKGSKKVVSVELTGVKSGDYECACMDVSAEDFERLTGEKPSSYDKSCFYKDLFRYYGLVIPRELIAEYGNNAMLKVKATFEIEKVGEAVEKDPNDDFDEDDDI